MLSEEIIAKIGLDSTAMSKGLRSMGERLNEFSQNAAKSLPGPLKAVASGAAASVGIIVSAVAVAAREFSKAVDFAKELRALQRQTDSSAESLQKLKLFLGDSFETGLRVLYDFRKSQGEALSGVKETVEAFAKFGIKIDQIRSLSPEDIFKRIAQAVKNGVSAEQFLAAVKLGGKSLEELLPKLGKDYGEFAKRLEKFNLVISESTIKTLADSGKGWTLYKTLASAALQKVKAEMSVAAITLGHLAKAALLIRFGNQGGAEDVLAERELIKAKDDGAVRIERNEQRLSAARAARADRIRKDEEKLKEIIADSQKKQIENIKKIGDAFKELVKRDQVLQQARKDRLKFGLEELADSPVAFRGRLGFEQRRAREIQQIETKAQGLRDRGFFDPALKLFNRAEDLRKTLTNVVDRDRFPFKSLEDSAREQADNLKELVRKANEEGIIIKPRNGK